MTVSAYRNQLPRLWTRTFSISGPDLYNSASGVKRAAQAKLDLVDSVRPFSGALVDSYNRRHDYLRISLTERCNLRCFYCMPEEGVQLSPNEKILTDEEILRLAKLFVQSGVTKIRLTGGEPTVRKGVVGIVGNRVNLAGSLDTLDPFKFEFMTKRSGLEAVLKTLKVALESPHLQKVKLNVVVVKGLNDNEVLDFVEMTKDRPISVCLFDAKEVSLRDEIRKGASDFEILRLIGRAVHGKEEKHLQMEDIDVVSNRPMILIGG
ncbi:hypothetical protein HHX47_DHR1001161 [Lentinula edodes]|nr:hypothetical protein HHX47_DHR1001161 [Lentinula edodes]